ncbi:MAG: protein-arginine deiminase family protein [Planctomycetaceae bacterium]
MRSAKLAVVARIMAAALVAWPPASTAITADGPGPRGIAVEIADGRTVLEVLANRDDDDRDGAADAADDRVNGPADERDLAPLVVRVADPRAARLRVSAREAPLRFFVREAEGWRHAGLGAAEVPVAPGADGRDGGGRTVTLHVESTAWAGLPAGWDGAARIAIEAVDAEGAVVGEAQADCRVAPVLLRPGTARATEVFVSSGRYDNEPFLAALRAALEPLGVSLVVHPAADWKEMWMQDTMEVATVSIPASRMHVVLDGLRGADGFPPTLLGPDTAVARVAEPRALSDGDDWADWYGNLEVSPPLVGHPAGRVIHGRNTRTGQTFHPEVVRFLAAQGAQAPLWIDTSWLMIKHVDEIVAFLPGPDGKGVLLVADPEEGLRLAGGLAADAAVVEANRRIARLIDEMLEGTDGTARAGVVGEDNAAGGRSSGLLDLLGLDRVRVVRLPVAFRVPAEGLDAAGGVTNAGTAWSSPVNALYVNGTVICGSADMPDTVRETCRERFLAAGATDVVFIDDGVYQHRGGNVHCATNARRE